MTPGVETRVRPRVASLLPSATEMLCAIGGEHLLVGRCHEDNYPLSITDRPILTATRLPENLTSAEIDATVSASVRDGDELYEILAEPFQELAPDVVLTQDLCNVCSVSPGDLRFAMSGMLDPPEVLCFNPYSIGDIFDDMLRLGAAVGLVEAAEEAVRKLRAQVAQVEEAIVEQPGPPPRIAFIEWADPVFIGGHWTPELVELAGGVHLLNTPGKKSFRVSQEAVAAEDPDYVVLCPCGLTLEQAQNEARSQTWLRNLRAVQEGRACCVDGDAMFNRPGPRLIQALLWLANWIMPAKGKRKRLPPPPADFPVSPWPVAPPPTEPLEDIEDFATVHRRAVERGQVNYQDPATGYSVFTELYMLGRGWCCGSGCRHCPYGHFNLEGRERTNKIQAPRLVGASGSRPAGRGPLVAWDGPQTVAQPGAVLCLVFSDQYKAVTEDQSSVPAVMDWARSRQLELLAVPAGHLGEALKLVCPAEWWAGGAALPGMEEWLEAMDVEVHTTELCQ